MLRVAFNAVRNSFLKYPITQSKHSALSTRITNSLQIRSLSFITPKFKTITNNSTQISSIKTVCVPLQPQVVGLQQQRTVTKFSLVKGKRKSVKAVIKRFKRLDWGGWIRTHSGRNKKMWKKSGALKRRLRQHIFVNATQSWLLDSMVTKFWRRPKHYVDDPYTPYHKRNEFFATRTKPLEK